MRRVLIIDDDRSVGAAIRTMLLYRNYEAVFVSNAFEAAQAFESSKFDLVLVDIFMPEIDGFEIIKGLRDQGATIPIIAMSGFSFRNSLASAPNFLEMALDLGATACLLKPFTPKQLMAVFDAGLSLNQSVSANKNDQQAAP